MICVIQRVAACSVTADGVPAAKQGAGLLLLLGVSSTDSREDSRVLAKKIARLRVFEDGDGKMNKSVTDIDGEVTVVSNFTLLAQYRKGNRPDYLNAARPEQATELYEDFKAALGEELAALGSERAVQSGVFGADMRIDAALDGPVTITMDSRVLLAK